jgi:5'-deoxynucleotidase YfbR-like HD superfamily hydrolase
MCIIETYSGKLIDLNCIDHNQINIEDIAYSLSRLCRYNGHTVEFWSVLDHTILITYLMQDDMCNPSEILYGIMHDFHEYLVGDISQPVKSYLKNRFELDFNIIEHEIDSKIYEAFSVPKPSDRILNLVKKYDLMCLYLEKNTDFIMPSKNKWFVDDMFDKDRLNESKYIFEYIRELSTEKRIEMFIDNFNYYLEDIGSENGFKFSI